MPSVTTIRRLSDLAQRLRARREEEEARLLEGVIAEILQETEEEQVLARDYLTTGQAARRIGVSLQTVKNWIAAGKLPARQVGGRFYIPRDAVQAYLERLAAQRPERLTQRPKELDSATKTLMRLVGRLPADKVVRYEQLVDRRDVGKPLSEAEQAEMAALLEEFAQGSPRADGRPGSGYTLL